MGPGAVARGLIKRFIRSASAFADDGDADKPVRLWHRGELVTPFAAPTRHGQADEGSYLTCTTCTTTNPNFGTALSYVVQTTFVDTTPFVYIFNNEPANGGASLCLDFLKIVVTVVPATTTQAHYAVVLDTQARFPTTNNMIAGLVDSPNSGQPNPFKAPTILWQNTSTASVVPASAVQTRQRAARGTLGGLPVIGDSLRIQFGSLDGGAATTATTAGNRADCSSPVELAPQHSAMVHLWFVGNATTAMSYEGELGAFFR